ncbi:sodium:proton antiporter NhaD [Thiohalobacter sp. IOR34]|uniref:sodium:proton antiporter NhaD n=1 Tax=Thiohalobacter sp. IOR34 TaxID=3057176 RepID=UPI0025B10F46|nr:sodium:proton antiporter NhaD [Thiohalobacter sp. IOR34]WJW74868.1 sodium:proton antiporter NhaD [Thiohalobacter sp. IOR34]
MYIQRHGPSCLTLLTLGLLLPFTTQASTGIQPLDFTGHWAGWLAVGIFVAAYALVIAEEAIHLRKSKPVIVAAGLIWLIVALLYQQQGDTHSAEQAVRHNLLEFAELFLFLLAAMTYINTMDERGVFEALRAWLISRGFSLRAIFWVTGLLAFFISPVADNLTTALLMATVVMAVGGSNHAFVATACINIVVAANAGGAFSPFGDITTLMVWQKGLVDFGQFFALFVPSLVNWLVPAVILGLTVPASPPEQTEASAALQYGAWVVVGLFLLTITMAVSAHNFLHLPPVLGMMTGLGLLKLYSYYLKRRSDFPLTPEESDFADTAFADDGVEGEAARRMTPFNVFKALERAEWDTLMFFYGIILCVGGLGTLGYLAIGSQLMYGDLGATQANILVGLLSAIVDNIPVMFAVLAMQPDMSLGNWLLVTLTAGVGGSLLSIGSAAGVAVMGQARGIYTFFAHLKWSWAIALGYAASIGIHFLINGESFKQAIG